MNVKRLVVAVAVAVVGCGPIAPATVVSVSATSSGFVVNVDGSFYHPPTGKGSALTKPKVYQP